MWEMPSIERSEPLQDNALLEVLPLRATHLQLVETFKHLLSHREIRFRIYTARTRARRGTWKTLEEIEDMAMSSAMRGAMRRVAESGIACS